MTGEFIKATQARVIDGGVRFTAFVAGGEPRVFEVSGAALSQHFGAGSVRAWSHAHYGSGGQGVGNACGRGIHRAGQRRFRRLKGGCVCQAATSKEQLRLKNSYV
jgi:hypothetical protein